jgi:WD40 repeat protein
MRIDKTIRIWDAHTGMLLNTIQAHNDLIRTIQFDQSRIVSGSYDATVKVWDIKTGTLLFEISGHRQRVFKVYLSDSKIITCSQDKVSVGKKEF